MPFFRSFVETLMDVLLCTSRSRTGRPAGRPWGSQDHEVRGRPRHRPAAVLRALHHVLDADPAEPRDVHAGLDRHDRAGRQLVLTLRTERWPLVDLESHAMPQRVAEGL